MKRGECERREKCQMSLSKCCQNVLTYETLKIMKRPISMYTLIKVLRLMYPLITNDEMRNNLLSYDVLILEASFHDI